MLVTAGGAAHYRQIRMFTGDRSSLRHNLCRHPTAVQGNPDQRVHIRVAISLYRNIEISWFMFIVCYSTLASAILMLE